MGKQKRMDEVRQILSTYTELGSYKATARRLGVSKNTIKRYVRLAKALDKDLFKVLQLPEPELLKVIYPVGVDANSDVETVFLSKVDDWFKALKKVGVTRQLIWEEYIGEHPDGYQYSWFCERLRQEIGRKDLTLAMHHRPGEKMQVDFAGKKLSWVDRSSGEVHQCEVLVAVMPYSQQSFVTALPSQKVGDFVEGLSQALLYFGGLPKVILSDNLKSFVKRADRYDPEFNELSSQLAAHYQLDLEAARVAKPKDKASVENAVRTAYTRIYAPLRDRELYSIEMLNQAILERLDIHNKTPYQKKEGWRQQVFERDELPLMRDLPPDLFQVKKITKAKVQRNYHVFLGEEKNYYSVPHQYAGRKTKVVYTNKVVEVYLNHQRIAIHDRLLGGTYRYQTKAEHMPKSHREWRQAQGFDGDYFLQKAERIGAATLWAVGHILTSRIHQPQSYKSCQGIFRLGEQYGNQRLELAAQRCKIIGKTNYNMLKRILRLNLDQVDQQPDLFKPPLHENIRGSKTYQ